jgi:hypothetical protein
MIEFIVKYILDENFINKTFLVGAFACPIIGFLIGITIDKIKKTGYKHTTIILAIGFLGTLNYLLWNLYGKFTEYFGLTTVKNLLFNLLFFVILGAIIGILFSLLFRFFNHHKINETQ